MHAAFLTEIGRQRTDQLIAAATAARSRRRVRGARRRIRLHWLAGAARPAAAP